MKPKVPIVPEANITQCRGENQLELTRCTLENYLAVKLERDSLRAVVEGIR
jgi:hypothetical protein